MKRFYKLKAHCSSLEPNEKPSTHAVHHEIRHYYQTLNYTCFTQETLFHMVCPWTMEFSVMFDRTLSFVVFLPYFGFTFTHHVQPIIEEVESVVEAEVDLDAMAVKVYDPLPSKVYVRLVEAKLLKTREALAQDSDYVEKETMKWHLIADFFHEKATGYEFPSPLDSHVFPSLIDLSSESNDSGDEFLKKLEEEFNVVKQ